VAGPSTMGVPRRPEPPGAPCGGAAAEPELCEGEGGVHIGPVLGCRSRGVSRSASVSAQRARGGAPGGATCGVVTTRKACSE